MTFMRKYWFPILQGFLSAFLIWHLFGNTTLRNEAAQVLKHADPYWLISGFGTALLCEFLCALRWWFMLRAFGIPVGLLRVCIFCGAGLFFSIGLPGGAGGDAFRILYIMRLYPGHKLRAALSVFADRLCGLVSLVFIFFVTTCWKRNLFLMDPDSRIILSIATIVLGSVVVMVFLWWLTTVPQLHALWLPRVPAIVRKRATRMGHIFTRLAKRPELVATGILVSIGALVIHFTTYFCSARSFRLPVSLADIFTVMPVVETLVLLPVTLYGIGLRETLFEHLLGGMFGVPLGAATLTSLGGFCLQAAVALLGAFCVPFTTLGRQGKGKMKNEKVRARKVVRSRASLHLRFHAFLLSL